MSMQSIFARAPAGVLVIGVLLILIGAGLIVAGVILLANGELGGWPVWLVLLASGPLAMYLALNFMYGRRWAWVAVVTLLCMLLVSAVVRTFASSGVPVAPLIEVFVTVGSLVYLYRARVRREFGH